MPPSGNVGEYFMSEVELYVILKPYFMRPQHCEPGGVGVKGKNKLCLRCYSYVKQWRIITARILLG